MREFYQNPLASRYASREMQEIFSDHRRYQIWRKLWLVLAEAEAEQGVSINRTQLQELREHQEDINYGFAALKEKALRNEVVAQLAAYSAQCGKASSILSLGAGADYVIENGDMIRLRAGLLRIKSLLVNAIAAMADFADENRALPCLAFRQMLPARVTTLGHRAACRLADLLADLEQLDSLLDSLRLHGCRGESGSASEMLKLLGDDQDKLAAVEAAIAAKFGFSGCYAICGPTVSAKVTSRALHILCDIAQSTVRFTNDLRLLILMGELHETAEPMEELPLISNHSPARHATRTERICALTRFVIEASHQVDYTPVTQWLDHTQDDEICRQVILPDAFMAADGMLALLVDVLENCSVNRTAINRNLSAALNGANPSSLTGLAIAQTEALLYDVVDPLLKKNQQLLGLEIRTEE